MNHLFIFIFDGLFHVQSVMAEVCDPAALDDDDDIIAELNAELSAPVSLKTNGTTPSASESENTPER